MLKLKFSKYKTECGTDEAGRGCLAGPVTAAAVILKDDFLNNDINDSKKISKKNRYRLKEIIEKNALEFSYSHTYFSSTRAQRRLHFCPSLRASLRACVRCRRGTPTLCTGIVVCLCQRRHSAAVGVYLEIALVIYSVLELPTLKV